MLPKYLLNEYLACYQLVSILTDWQLSIYQIIFRLDENGKIVEHWDVIQAVPEKTESGRGMF